MRIRILGIPIDSLTAGEAAQRLLSFLREPRARHVVTPNSEMLVQAFRDAAFRDVLLGSALNLPDSAGLLFAARLTGRRLPERVTGVDIVERLCMVLDESHPVYFLGGREGVAAATATALRKMNPALVVCGTDPGDPDDAGVPGRIRAAAPHVLFVAYGAPRQDLWIAKHLRDLPSVRVAMGVGGTFDFLAGRIKRAPHIFRSLGLEWLWRLIQEPRRIKRIRNAVVVFPLLVKKSNQKPKTSNQ